MRSLGSGPHHPNRQGGAWLVTIPTRGSAQHVINLIRIVLEGTKATEQRILDLVVPQMPDDAGLLAVTLRAVRGELDNAEKQIPREVRSDQAKAIDLESGLL